MDLLGGFWATGWLAGRPLRPASHHGRGGPDVYRHLGAHRPDRRPLAIPPLLRHPHERFPGHFPGAVDHGGHYVVPEAPGVGHGAVAVRPGPGELAVCTADGPAVDPTGLALGLLGAWHCGRAAAVVAHPFFP